MRPSLLEIAVEAVSHLEWTLPPSEPSAFRCGGAPAWRGSPDLPRSGMLAAAPQLPAVTFAMLIDVDAALA